MCEVFTPKLSGGITGKRILAHRNHSIINAVSAPCSRCQQIVMLLCQCCLNSYLWHANSVSHSAFIFTMGFFPKTKIGIFHEIISTRRDVKCTKQAKVEWRFHLAERNRSWGFFLLLLYWFYTVCYLVDTKLGKV